MAKRGMGWATKLVCSEEDLEDFQDLTQEEHDDKIHSGFIKYFNERTGFGFIACSNTWKNFGCDVFLHYSQLNGFSVGDSVQFKIVFDPVNVIQILLFRYCLM